MQIATFNSSCSWRWPVC